MADPGAPAATAGTAEVAEVAAAAAVEELGFEGEPFLLPVLPVLPVPQAPPTPQATPRGLGDLSHLARDIADRVSRAHAAVLEAHEAVQQHLLARYVPGARLPAAPAPHPTGRMDRPARVELVRTVPADSDYSVAGQADPVWILDAAAAALPLLGERGLAAAGTVHRPGRTVLTWHRELPEAGAELRVRAGAEAVHRDERGTRFTFDWQVHVEGNLLVEATGTGGFLLPEHAIEPLPDEDPWPERHVPRYPRQFRPLAVTHRSRLTWQELRALAGGFLTEVLGPDFEGESTGPRLPGPAPRLIGTVAEPAGEGGRYGQGKVTAELTFHGGGPGRGVDATALLAEAVAGVLQVYALRRGLHLCLPDPRFQPWDGGPTTIEVIDPTALGAALRCEVDVAEVGLVPRPHAVADAVVLAGDRPVARLHGIGVALHEPPGTGLGALTVWEARDSPAAHESLRQHGALQRMLLAHSAEGDLSAVTGEPQATSATSATSATVRPRLPRGDLMMVDRALEYDAEPLDFRPGATLTSEYAVHPDPWFCRENGSGAVPNLLYMESSLQAAAQLSAIQGILHQHRDSAFVCRNLEGRATLLRHADPRGLALRHRTMLADHSKLPGAILHRYAYQLSLPDGPVYSGESVHGFLTKEVLDNQQGLDGGRYAPPWLDRLPTRPPGLRRLDLSRDARLGRGRFALLREADLVVDGGEHGAGYLLWERTVPKDDWFMAHHFRFDPVMPGSVGVEALFQSVAAYALHAGLADSLPDPAARPAAHVELAWKYRGQITPGHRRMRGEVHIRRVRRRGDGLLLVADGSVWRDDLRIYQVDNIGVEILPTGGTTDGKVPR
ncbi:3-hydroxyacyl-ACP dehydratase [Streptomyces sp. LZ34]